MSLPSSARLLLLTRRCTLSCSLSRLSTTSSAPTLSHPAASRATSPSGSSTRRSPQTGQGTLREGGERARRVPRRERYPELARLEKAEHKLSFRSLPYSSPPSLLFPSPSSQPLQFNYTPPSRSWSLRCFPSPKRTESRRPAPPPALPQPRPRARSGEEEPAAEEEEEEAREEELLLLQKKPKKRPSYTLDLTLLVSKKKVHKSAVVRNRCKRRVWEAVRLVVERGARGARGEGVGEGAAGSVSFVEGEREKKRETGPRKWLLPGYHYILTLSSLDIYRATPLPQLVDELGKGLKEVKRKAENATLSLRLSQISDSFALSSSPPFSSPDSPTSPPPTSSPLSTSAKLAPFLARADEAREDVVADPEEEKALRRVRERAEGQKSWDESVVGQEEEEVEVL